jgi:hypothetical protein
LDRQEKHASSTKLLRSKQAISGQRVYQLLCFLICIWLSSTVATAQVQAETKHRFTFGQSATFDLVLTDFSAFSDYELYISLQGSNVYSHPVEVTNGIVSYERDLRDKPLSPFSYITYWWEFVDSNDNLVSTDKQTFQYVDNRFEWAMYSENDIRIHWVEGVKSAMINGAAIVNRTIDEVQFALQKDMAPSVDVYIYPSNRDLQTALQLAGYEWVAGATYPELGVILLSVPDGNQALSQMQRIIPHETTHKLLYDAYGSEGYKHIPSWLEEGLASYFEAIPDPEFVLALTEANTNSTLLSFQALCNPFPAEPTINLLSYAQSESMTRYIQQKYGWSAVRQLLQLYTEEGVSCTSGLENVLDIQIIQFEREWRVWLKTSGNQTSDDVERTLFNLSPEINAAISIFVKEVSQWIFLSLLLVLPLLFFSFQTFLRKRSSR